MPDDPAFPAEFDIGAITLAARRRAGHVLFI
jgi:hypothetical protein